MLVAIASPCDSTVRGTCVPSRSASASTSASFRLRWKLQTRIWRIRGHTQGCRRPRTHLCHRLCSRQREDAMFWAVLVRDGKAADARYCEPFDFLFSSRRFEYWDLAGREGFELFVSHPESTGRRNQANNVKQPRVQAPSHSRR